MIYTYRCAPCDFEFDAKGSMKTASDPHPCPKCGYDADRTLKVGGIRIKGGTPVHHGSTSR